MLPNQAPGLFALRQHYKRPAGDEEAWSTVSEHALQRAAGTLFLIAAILLGVAALPGQVAAPQQVVTHVDGLLPGHWAAWHPSGLLVLVGPPFEKYEGIGAPTFDVSVYNLSASPALVGPQNFRVVHNGQFHRLYDGEPSFASATLAPGHHRRGRLTYYEGRDVLGLRFEHQGEAVDIRLDRQDYPQVGSVGEWVSAWVTQLLGDTAIGQPSEGKAEAHAH